MPREATRRPPRPAGNQVDVGRGSVMYRGVSIDYEIRRSTRRRKTIEVKLTRDGLRVYTPWEATDDQVREFVRRLAPRIVTWKVAKVEPLQFVAGETVPYLGKESPLVFGIAADGAPRVLHTRGGFHIEVPAGVVGDARRTLIKGLLIEWYTDQAKRYLPEAVDRWWPALRFGHKPRVLIRSQRARWGSCGVDGTLRFNWKLMMLDPALVDYAVVHELAHLHVRNHSAAFWNVVRRVLPDVDRRRAQLKKDGVVGYKL